MENHYGLLLIWLLPIMGGIVAFALGKKKHSARNDCIDIVMFVELIGLTCIGYQIAHNWTTLSLSLSLFGMGLFLSIDWVRLLFCAMATFVFGIVSLFMKESMKEEKGSDRFYLLYMGLFGMVLGAFLADDFFCLTMFLTFAFLFAYPLMIHRPNTLALKNAGVSLFFSLIAILFLISGILIVVGYLGSVNYVQMYTTVVLNGYSYGQFTGAMLLFVGFAICAGLFPLQFQVTRGNSSGLIETSTVLTCTVSKIGVLGILLLGANMMNGSGIFVRTLLVMGIATAIWGVIVTLTSTDIRKILMGLDVTFNGMNILSAALMVVGGESNAYVVRSSLYMLMMSSLSLLVLYMVALELVREVNTYEIKGLIAAGKPHKLLAAGCLLACANLAGIPGTTGFLAYSLMYQFILRIAHWTWLVVVFLILWAFVATAVVRVFMKFFISKKDETLRILATEEELANTEDKVEEQEPDADQKEDEDQVLNNTKNPYRMGEVLLILIGVLQVMVGVLPQYTVGYLSKAINVYFKGKELSNAVSYYTADAWIAFGIIAILCLVLYVNLVHGILLRATRNKKNKKLQKENELQED